MPLRNRLAVIVNSMQITFFSPLSFFNIAKKVIYVGFYFAKTFKIMLTQQQRRGLIHGMNIDCLKKMPG